MWKNVLRFFFHNLRKRSYRLYCFGMGNIKRALGSCIGILLKKFDSILKVTDILFYCCGWSHFEKAQHVNNSCAWLWFKICSASAAQLYLSGELWGHIRDWILERIFQIRYNRFAHQILTFQSYVEYSNWLWWCNFKFQIMFHIINKVLKVYAWNEVSQSCHSKPAGSKLRISDTLTQQNLRISFLQSHWRS